MKYLPPLFEYCNKKLSKTKAHPPFTWRGRPRVKLKTSRVTMVQVIKYL
jgi:hypothetical protein